MQKRQETDALHNPIVAYSIILSTHPETQISKHNEFVKSFMGKKKAAAFCRCLLELPLLVSHRSKRRFHDSPQMHSSEQHS